MDGPLPQALEGVRVCDLTGQLAGAGATRWLAAFGADVIRIEDPRTEGRWDVLRGIAPFVDDRRGNEFGGGFNNVNVGKRGITIDLRTEAGRDVFADLVTHSDVVAENFSAGTLARLGFPYEVLRSIRPDVVYVSNSGFGATGPNSSYRTWGQIVQACCGLTFGTGLPGLSPAGIGWSYMDHHGASYMAIAILAGLLHRWQTGEGQWIDMACVEAGATLLGPAILDCTVNGRGLRHPGAPHSNRSTSPRMVPHGVYPARGDDRWVAVACRDDDDWRRATDVIGEEWATDPAFQALEGRARAEEALDRAFSRWSATKVAEDIASGFVRVGVPAAPVQRPGERIDADPATAGWGLWPMVDHPQMGSVRVDGLPVHLRGSDWVIDRPAPLLGQHTDEVLRDVLGLSEERIDALSRQGAV